MFNELLPLEDPVDPEGRPVTMLTDREEDLRSFLKLIYDIP